jgi:hypothetical protein
MAYAKFLPFGLLKVVHWVSWTVKHPYKKWLSFLLPLIPDTSKLSIIV